MSQIIPSSLREEARRAIRAGVVTGEIRSGEIYSVPSIAERLGVSATPVREALLDLANEGLVEPVRNRGFRIVVLDDQDLDEIFELRTLLEVPAVGRVAGRLDSRQLEIAQTALAELEAAAEARDLARYLTADQEFHRSLLEPLGNQRLVDLVGRLRDQQRLYGMPDLLHSASFLATASEHRRIFDAVSGGDKRLAESLMKKHLRHTRGVWAGADEPEDVGGGVSPTV